MSEPPHVRNPVERLTARQAEVLRLLHSARTTKQIAIELGLSPNTVDQHLKAARRILEVSDSGVAARMLVAYETNPHPQKQVNQPNPLGNPPFDAAPRSLSGPGVGERSIAETERNSLVERRPSRALLRLWRTGERPINDMSRLQRLIASFGLTVAMATVAGIIIIAIVLLMQFLINISRHGG